MADEVATSIEEQSPVTPVETPVVEATAPEEDLATWKKRLAGKDQALTATKKELDAIKAEAESLRKWKAEVEFANMTELEKANVRTQQLEQELQAARVAAQEEALARKHPTYAKFAAEIKGLDAVAQAEAFEKFVTSVKNESTTDTYVDTNSPRKAAPPAASKRGSTDISKELESLGNPFYDGN
jgi:hypothetical protein